ncbi:MAG: radical SAM protein [archaeon]|nr:radical SAM protein [archaeon]
MAALVKRALFMPKKYVLKDRVLYNLIDEEKYLLDNIKELSKIKDDNIKDILLKERRGIRETIDIQITGKCNLKCAHCYIGEKEYKDIPFEDLKRLFDSAKELGVFNVVLTGGEPTMHNDFDKIVDYLNENRFRIILVTNGTFIDKKLEKLKGKIYDLVISLDGFKKDYEKIRGCDYNKTIDNLYKVKNSGINFRINAILHKNLIKYYKKFSKFIKTEFGCPIMFIPVGSLGFANDNQWVVGDYSKVGKIIKSVGCFQDKTNCKFYYKQMAIDYKGFIYPCQFFREIDSYKLGNIFEDDLKEISKKIDGLKIIPETNGSACKGCKFKKKCGAGCRGRAQAYNYDPDTPDPLWHDIFLGIKGDKVFFPKLKNPLYDRIDYSKYPMSMELQDRMKEVILKLQGNKFLEIGCGDGTFLKSLAIKNPENEYLGIDNSKQMINKAMNLSGKNIVFKLSELKDLNKNYDVTFAVYSFFNHLKNIEEIKGFFNKLKTLTKWFVFDANAYGLFPKESIMKDKFGDCEMIEYVKQTGRYISSIRRYNFDGTSYFYASSWPIVNWEIFLKQYGFVKKIKIGKRNIFILQINNK